MSESLDQLAGQLGSRLLGAGLRLALAESCTGGWVAKVITDIAGSSRWFDCGFVVYSDRAKCSMLGVNSRTLNRCGAVSEVVVNEMAVGALVKSGADVSVAVSGIAGPGGGSEEKPVGTVWFAWGVRGKSPVARCFQLAGSRDEVRHQAVRIALAKLLEIVEARGAASRFGG